MLKTKTVDKETATSLQFVFISFIPLINYIIGVWFGSGGLYISLIMILVLSAYKLTIRGSLTVSAAWLAFFSVLVLYGVLSRNSDLTALQMILYIFLPAIVATSKIDMHKFLRFSTYSALFLLLVFPTLIRDLSNEGIRQISINGISYAVLPVFVAGLFHFTLYRKEETNLVIRICYIIDVLVGALLIAYGNRGVVLSVVIAVFIAIVFNQKDRITFNRGIFLTVLFIASIVLVLNIQSVLVYLYDVTSKFGIELTFINKFTLLNQMQDLSNGRNAIREYVLSHVGETLVWGHGLSTIYHNSGGSIVYPHNLIIQLLYDGGLLLSVPVLFLLISAAIYLFRGKEQNIRMLILFFSVVCIPKMMLSSDIWLNPAFWLFIFAMFNHSGRNLYRQNSASD